MLFESKHYLILFILFSTKKNILIKEEIGIILCSKSICFIVRVANKQIEKCINEYNDGTEVDHNPLYLETLKKRLIISKVFFFSEDNDYY